MLQVTDDAAAVFRDILAAQDISAEMIRLVPPEGDEGGFEIMAATAPDPKDIHADASGVDVYVAAELADELDALVLDAEQTPDGPSFTIHRQG